MPPYNYYRVIFLNTRISPQRKGIGWIMGDSREWVKKEIEDYYGKNSALIIEKVDRTILNEVDHIFD